MVTVTARFQLADVTAAGVIGGLLFALFEMIAAAVLMGSHALFMPLRMIGAMVLGAEALDREYSLLVAASAGVMVHMCLSVVFAMVFAWIASPARSDSMLAVGGILFGTVLWVVNFYVIAPLAGWMWFLDRTNPVIQFIAHAFFYGCPVGWYLGRFRTIIVHRQ